VMELKTMPPKTKFLILGGGVLVLFFLFRAVKGGGAAQGGGGLTSAELLQAQAEMTEEITEKMTGAFTSISQQQTQSSDKLLEMMGGITTSITKAITDSNAATTTAITTSNQSILQAITQSGDAMQRLLTGNNNALTKMIQEMQTSSSSMFERLTKTQNETLSKLADLLSKQSQPPAYPTTPPPTQPTGDYKQPGQGLPDPFDIIRTINDNVARNRDKLSKSQIDEFHRQKVQAAAAKGWTVDSSGYVYDKSGQKVSGLDPGTTLPN